jgi:hypothetical protein
MFGRGRLAGCIAAFLCWLPIPATAEANPPAAITSAITNPEWTVGSFAGSVTFDASDCPPGPLCTWRADLTLQPHVPEYPCRAENYLYGGDPNVVVMWSVENQTPSPTPVVFDERDRPLLSGVIRQRLCLYVAYNTPVYGEDVTRTIGAARDFIVPASPPAPGGGGGGVGSGSSGGGIGASTKKTPAPTAVLTRASAVAKAKAALKRKFGRSYNRAKKKKLSCSKKSASVYRCKFSFRNGKRKRSGTVTVRRTAEGIKATVK